MNAASPGLPDAFVDRLRQIVPAAHFPDALASFGADKPTSFRVNTLRAPQEQTLRELHSLGIPTTPVGWCDTAHTVLPTHRTALAHSDASGDGRLYIQGLSSMLAALVLDPQPDEQVLDLAAAPGGKTLHLCARMRGRGAVAAVEPVRDRFFKLKANVERAGVGGMVRLYQSDGRLVGRKTPGRFDRVLIDAPCSSEARFRADDPGSFARWGPKKIAESARKQKALLRSAVDACRVGGRVLYCTCSLAPEENEAVVAHTLRRLGKAVVVRGIELPVSPVQPGLTDWRGRSWPVDLAETRRVLPTAETDAFYLALLEKQKPTA